ncbi:MAG: hypothetical protein KGI94_10715 [Paracoccaceae bacterium]|nr:hypothetical protein [Paracoccaceae bacterium]MDE3120673.1 hypothetical protein [Paracoccaceae bacterium]
MRSLLLSAAAALMLTAPLAGAQTAPAAQGTTQQTAPQKHVAKKPHVKSYTVHGTVAAFNGGSQVVRLTDGAVFHLLKSAHTAHLKKGEKVTLVWHYGIKNKHTRYVSSLKAGA